MPPPALCATSAARLRLLLPSASCALSLRAAAASAALAPAKQRLLFSTTGMAAAAGAKASTQPAAGGGVSERIMPHLLNIYGSCATAQDFEMYAPNATFEDPLMRAHGVKQIKSAFYTMPKVFGESKIAEYTIKENTTGPGKSQAIKSSSSALDDTDRQQATLQGLWQGCRPRVPHHTRRRGWQGRQAPGLVGQEASQEQGDGELPAVGTAGADEPPGSHAAHPCSHGLRQRPHPVI